MSDSSVKKSGRRGDQARATRRRIVDAAAALFIDQGYAGTAITEIAERAGVAVQTVYFHFGNKRALVKEAVDVAAVGDDAPVPLMERPWMEQLRSEPDPGRVIALWVEQGSAIFVRVAPIMGVVREAAASDADMAQQWSVNEQQRLTAFQMLVEALADLGALRPGLSAEEATDLVFALNSLEMFTLLTTGRGWSVAQWEDWLARTLAASLLADLPGRAAGD